MAQSKLEIIMSLVDKASPGLKGFSKAFKDITGVSLGTVTALGAVSFATKKLIDFTKDSVKETLAYTKTVRDLAQNLNITTEETSRLIQTADDYGVTMGQVETAMKMALRNGFAPSIDTLAEMADKYNSLQNPTERAAALTKVFGRNWAELTPMLKEGGEAIRATAKAQSGALIVTAKSAKAARDNEIAMDAFNDSLTNVKYTVGNGLMPVLTDFYKLLDREAKVTFDLIDMSGEIIRLAKLRQAVVMQLGREEGNLLHTTEEEIGASMNYIAGVTREEEIRRAAIEKTTEALGVQGEWLVTSGIQAWQKFKMPVLDYQKALDAVVRKYDDITSAIDGRLGPAQEDFNKTQDEVKAKMQETLDKIGELEGKSYLTNAQKDELAELKGKYGELSGEYDTNATEHEKATKRIMYDLLVQRAGIDGLTSQEMTLLGNVALKWGLVDQATLNTAQEMDKALSAFANGAGMTATIGGIDYILSKDGEVINLEIVTNHIDRYTTEQGPGGSREGGRYQSGTHGWQTVPSGYPNDSYRVGLSSGEKFNVVPSNTYNFTLNMHSAASKSSVINDFNLLKALARN